MNLYDTNALVQVVPTLLVGTNFLLDKFFPGNIVSDTEFVSIDVEIGKRRIAPFVSPMVEGKVVEQRRIQTNVFRPPYIKDKRAPDVRKPIRRMIGERIGGDMSGAAREAANIAAEMTDQIDMINRRLEWMAARALLTGKVICKGDGFPEVEVDYGRDALLSVANTGTTKWTIANITAGNASPTNDIEAWQRLVLKKSGAVATDIVFTTSAWQGFIADPLLKGAVYYPRLGESGNTVDPGARIGRGGIYKGRWGQYDLWMYNEWYVDSGTEGGTEDTEYPMLTDGSLIMSGPDLQGTRAFGQIIDPDHNYASLPFAPKIWTNKDPAQRYLLMQSAPIVVPARANAAIGATVCDPVYT